MSEKYHHGNLREELLSCAMESVRHGKIDQFSLRGTAKQLGVSPAAVYHHFADKEALTNAVIRETGHLLNTKMQEALIPEPQPGDNAMILGLAYIDFAIEDPFLFAQLTATACVEARDIQENSLKMVADAIVKDLPEHNFTTTELQERVWAAWAVSHGFASLALAGQMTPEQARVTFIKQCHPEYPSNE